MVKIIYFLFMALLGILIGNILVGIARADCLFFCGSAYSAGDGQSVQSSKWNGKYGKEAFAQHEINHSYSVSRSRAAGLKDQHEIDLTHQAKTGSQYPGGYADNGLGGKGHTSSESGESGHGNR
jgi:hypothetical protein